MGEGGIKKMAKKREAIKKFGAEGVGVGAKKKKMVFKKYTPPPHILYDQSLIGAVESPSKFLSLDFYIYLLPPTPSHT